MCCPLRSEYFHPLAYSLSYKRSSTFTQTQSDNPYEHNPLPFCSYKNINAQTYIITNYFQQVQTILQQTNSDHLARVAQSVQRLPTSWTVRGSNPGGARFSAPVQTGPEAHPASCTMGTESFPGVRCCQGVTLTPHPLLVQRSKLEQSYTSTLPKGLRGL